MTERTITLDKRFRTEYGFLFRALTTLGIPHAESHTESRFRIFTAETGKNRCALNGYLAEILLTPFRFRYFVGAGIVPELLTDYLMLFSAMNAGGAAEYVSIMEVIEHQSELHIDALYNFGIAEHKQRWMRRAKLVSDFKQTTPSLSEIIEFCTCLIEATPARTERKIRYMLSDDENVCILQRSIYYGEKITRFGADVQNAKALLGKLTIL